MNKLTVSLKSTTILICYVISVLIGIDANADAGVKSGSVPAVQSSMKNSQGLL